MLTHFLSFLESFTESPYDFWAIGNIGALVLGTVLLCLLLAMGWPTIRRRYVRWWIRRDITTQLSAKDEALLADCRARFEMWKREHAAAQLEWDANDRLFHGEQLTADEVKSLVRRQMYDASKHVEGVKLAPKTPFLPEPQDAGEQWAADYRKRRQELNAIMRRDFMSDSHYLPKFCETRTGAEGREWKTVCGTWLTLGTLYSTEPTCPQCRLWLAADVQTDGRNKLENRC